MRLLGCAIVRDESDIIELMVRHNLAYLDGLAIIDHASTDGTSQILAALVAEGLPITVTREADPKFRQKAHINALVRHWLQASDVDWFFVIDADEFIAAPSREAMRRTLAALPADRPGRLEWPTYLPDFEPGLPLAARLAHPRRVTDPGHAFRKMALPRAALSPAGIEIGFGQHVLESAQPEVVVPEPFPVPRDEIAIAHVPIRSPEQFALKVTTGWLSLVAGERRRVAEAGQWRDAFDLIVRGASIDRAMLERFAANYSVPPADWRPVGSLIVDAAPFLQPVVERYHALAKQRTLAWALRHAERLLIAR
jgi:hypothetical protein